MTRKLGNFASGRAYCLPYCKAVLLTTLNNLATLNTFRRLGFFTTRVISGLVPESGEDRALGFGGVGRMTVSVYVPGRLPRRGGILVQY